MNPGARSLRGMGKRRCDIAVKSDIEDAMQEWGSSPACAGLGPTNPDLRLEA